MRRRLLPLALIAGTLVSAIGASPASAQVCEVLGNCPTTTTTTTTTTTSTTTTSTTTTTTTAPPETTTTSSPTTTTSSATSTTSTTSSTTSTTAPAAGAAGGLRVSAPTSVVLSTGTPVNAGTLSAALGEVQVVDERAGLARGWIATVTSTDFTTGSGSAAETIAPSNVWYWSGAATATSGVATFVPGQLTDLTAVQLSTAQTAFSGTVTSGAASATWVPTVRVQVPSTAVAGEYHGTITHSVA